MKFYTEEETLDMVLGEKGSEARDEYEAKVDEFLGIVTSHYEEWISADFLLDTVGCLALC